MKPAVARLAITTFLFAGWMGYLGFQVATRPRTSAGKPLVLSQPQILASQIDVIATVSDIGGKDVLITQVLYPQGAALKSGDTIQVVNIRECGPPQRDREGDVKDWNGPGDYLLPLRPLGGNNRYEVAPIPPSPGFYTGEPRPRIYPAVEAALTQYRHIDKPR
jgi:hypothetical protein